MIVDQDIRLQHQKGNSKACTLLRPLKNGEWYSLIKNNINIIDTY